MMIIKVLFWVLIVYALILAVTYFFQDKLLFLPEKLRADYDFNLSSQDEEINLTTSDGVTINAIYYARPNNKVVVIYYHGNADSLSSWKSVADELLALNCNVLIIDYRGYGKSSGVPSESGLYQDAEAAYDYARQQGFTDSQIIFYGRSLGSGVAVEMALRHPVKGLILETPYTHLTAVAKFHYWYLLPTLLLHYQFDSINKLSKITMPVLLLHGKRDEVIPLSESEALAKVIKTPHELVVFDAGDHLNLDTFPEHKDAIQQFLSGS